MFSKNILLFLPFLKDHQKKTEEIRIIFQMKIFRMQQFGTLGRSYSSNDRKIIIFGSITYKYHLLKILNTIKLSKRTFPLTQIFSLKIHIVEPESCFKDFFKIKVLAWKALSTWTSIPQSAIDFVKLSA